MTVVNWEFSIHDRREVVDGMRTPNGIDMVERMYVQLPPVQWVEARETVGRAIAMATMTSVATVM